MIILTLSDESAKKISNLLKQEWNKENKNNKYTYDFEVIARYIDLALEEK